MVSRSISSVAKQGGRRALRTWGRATANSRELPSFLIVGGQRCGTTSLHRTLNQHPALLAPTNHKGVHYFDMSYGKGMSWYRSYFASSRKIAKVQLETGLLSLSYESSPYYMFHPLAPDRISADLPNVKVIVLVREPSERAYSAHAHEVARGFEDLSFPDALVAEDSRLAGEAERLLADPEYRSHAHRHQAYRARGRYVEGLRSLEAALGRDRIHVVDSQKFFTNPRPAYLELLEFLEVPDIGSPNFEQYNARPRSEMPDEIRTELETYFAPYDEQLAQWLGWSPSWRG